MTGLRSRLRSRPDEGSRMCMGSRMSEPTQQTQNPSTDGESSSRYTAIETLSQQRCSNKFKSNSSNSNIYFSSDVISFLVQCVLYSKQLDSIENSLNVFKYDNMDLNKFWLKYFGVVNLSDHKCTFLELSVLGKGLKFCLTPPKYCHVKSKESTDKFF